MGMMPDFELDYRKKEIEHYQRMIEDGKMHCEVTTLSVVKMLAENLSYRARIDFLMERILQHDFTIPQRIMLPNDMTVNKDGSMVVSQSEIIVWLNLSKTETYLRLRLCPSVLVKRKDIAFRSSYPTQKDRCQC